MAAGLTHTTHFHQIMRVSRAALLDIQQGQWTRWNLEHEDLINFIDIARRATQVRLRGPLLRPSEIESLLRRGAPSMEFSEQDPTGGIAYTHARVTLHFTPLVPEMLASWRPASGYAYRDIAAPTNALDALARLEDLEGAAWSLAEAKSVSPSSFRRLYAFVDAGVLWSTRELNL